jgi:NAD(P)-dependent dehydrogenase (short-subunit alcohol dehydrogenase family)
MNEFPERRSILGEIDWFSFTSNVRSATFFATGSLAVFGNPSMGSFKVVVPWFTGSSLGREARALWGAYSVSKVATEAMSKIFAAENTYPNIRFNCINPGGTRTAMRAKAYPEEDPKILPTPDSIMPAYLYLMGDDSLDMNGQSIDAQS